MDLHGAVVAITGASGGIGEATAVLLGGRGARLVLGARRAGQLDAVAGRVRAAGGDAVTVVTDVRRREDLAALVGTARARFGRLDALVANAGVGLVSPLDALRVDDWDEMVDVNVRGVLHGVAAALPVFREQGSGHFVTVVSTAGLRITPDQVVYAATKNAVRTLSEGMRQEAAPALRVTAVSPGFTATEFVGGIADDAIRERYTRTRDEIAMPPEAVARAIAFALEQPDGVDVGEIVVRPTAQA
ncbi:SDR family oxidoreductase [Actinomycetospora sp. TBRC 11914]|uniref:SDR family oxidoreductase n=1 Tax=Actinomycetospora sp. TBRC 11914 TaxID=2729387 RepID=UPI00145EEBFC|nr:SDR family oxidoreductase [Actinomycetospora sp. TBRC 11914]NMO92716.1 SDR family oxidoreductase [Actinomycetospora sp. TBRC 11914]